MALALAGKGVAVVSVDYRLAPLRGLNWLCRGGDSPRGRFPLPMEDLVTQLREVSRQSAEGLIRGGASAGAYLAASAALRTLKMDLNLGGVILAYGFFHALHPRPAEIQRRVRGHRRITHARWVLNALNRNYAGVTALSDRFAFPGGHDVSGFPDTLMINADRDSMRASGDLFAAELRGAGADVEHHMRPESRHAFLNRPGVQDFTTAIELMASWCVDRSGPPSAAK